jgi:cytochrome c peroxidase
VRARRTQSLRGILGTEPFHWNGDVKDFSMLVTEVFVGRMGGFAPSDDQRAALSHWIDRQPSLAAPPSAAARGKQLFESDAVGCASCHAGAHLTNNAYADVGTGAGLQVPSLHGVSFRTPLMHNGCAATLADRFNSTCGGGDQHGHTSQLSPTQIGDLTEYLRTL